MKTNWSRARYLPLTLALVSIMIGCASTGTGRLNSPPPAWVTSAPRDTDSAMYFVGSAREDSGSLPKAEENATYALIAEITRYLGVDVTAETTSEARAELDSFTSNLTQVVKQSSSARVEGFRIADRWVHEAEGAITVYLLGEYDRKEIEAERERLAEIERTKARAVSVPEQEGKRLESDGRYFDAIKKYIEAAAAAYKSDLANAKVFFERNINSARAIVSKLNLSAVRDKIQAPVGTPFADALEVRVLFGEGSGAKPVADVSLEVSYRETLAGRVTVKNAALLSDRNGSVVFLPPAATSVGPVNVTFRLDLESYLEPLRGVPAELKPQVNALEDLIVSRRAVLTYTSFSRAKDIPTGVVILDVDKAQNPMSSGETASGVLQGLTKAGFNVSALPFDAALLKGMNDAQVVELLSKLYGNSVERIVFGVIGIEEFTQDGDQFLVKVSGSVKTADIRNGKILYTNQTFNRGIGKNSASAVSAAFRNLGVKFGEDLAAKLP